MEKYPHWESILVGKSNQRTLWVLWESIPDILPPSEPVLSFLFPRDEEDLRARQTSDVVLGREEVGFCKADAVRVFREVSARVGVAQHSSGNTLRQLLARPGEASDWWYHILSFRDSESLSHFNSISQVLAIDRTRARLCVGNIVLWKASAGVAEALRGKCNVETHGHRSPRPDLWYVLRGAASRARYLLLISLQRFGLWRTYTQPAPEIWDIALTTFWDSCIGVKTNSVSLADRYFKRLGEELGDRLGLRIGYFAWLDRPSGILSNFALSKTLRPLRARKEIVVLQSLLTYGDAFVTVLDWRTAFRCARALKWGNLANAMIEDGFDWFPLLRSELMRGVFNADIAVYRLAALATERAAATYRPRMSISFLEFFRQSRAHYEGMRRAGTSVADWAMQHAGVCREKTFCYLHPQGEKAGEPDGCEVPHPIGIFVMGRHGHQMFLESGYLPCQLPMTGSARYDNVRMPGTNDRTTVSHLGATRVLLACSLAINVEIALVEAVVLAIEGISDVAVRLRNHPLSRVDQHPRFPASRAFVEISDRPLSEDLGWADLVIFSYSTVADEAFLEGKACWQWLPSGFDGSALITVTSIPRFGSVPALREALLEFQAAPEKFTPSLEARQHVAEQLFYPADGRAAERIADACIEFLRQH